jgi:hypothetical protein
MPGDICQIHELIYSDHCVTNELWCTLPSGKACVVEIDEELVFSTVCLKVDASKDVRKAIGTDCLHWNDTGCEGFQLQIVTWIETWGHHF